MGTCPLHVNLYMLLAWLINICDQICQNWSSSHPVEYHMRLPSLYCYTNNLKIHAYITASSLLVCFYWGLLISEAYLTCRNAWMVFKCHWSDWTSSHAPSQKSPHNWLMRLAIKFFYDIQSLVRPQTRLSACVQFVWTRNSTILWLPTTHRH